MIVIPGIIILLPASFSQEMGLEWIEWVVDVIPGRDGPENMSILKRREVAARPSKRAVGFFGFDQIRSVWVSTSWDLRPKMRRAWEVSDCIIIIIIIIDITVYNSINVTLTFNSFFSSLARSKYLFIFSLCFIFTPLELKNLLDSKFSFFLVNQYEVRSSGRD